MEFFEGVGDVFEKDETEDDVLVLGGIDVFSEFVGGLPELLFDGFFFLLFCFGHGGSIAGFLSLSEQRNRRPGSPYTAVVPFAAWKNC